jgi:hypothetical protein
MTASISTIIRTGAWAVVSAPRRMISMTRIARGVSHQQEADAAGDHGEASRESSLPHVLPLGQEDPSQGEDQRRAPRHQGPGAVVVPYLRGIDLDACEEEQHAQAELGDEGDARALVGEVQSVRSDRHPRREQEDDLGQTHARKQAEHDRRERRDADDEGQGPEGLGLIHASALPIATHGEYGAGLG